VGLRVVPLRELIEWKLASGITGAARHQDLADVENLIKVNNLAENFGDRLHPFVQAKYRELWKGTQVKDPYQE
jgi:hypothetical protein